MNIIETITHGSIIGKIYYDEDPANPRELCDYVGKMVCFHRRYNLGDSHNYGTPEEFQQEWDSNPKWLVLPLYLYDHSGLTISTGPFHCPWDSGQIGWIYCTQEQIDQEWGGNREKAQQHLEGQAETYDQYLTGQVYGYVVENADEDQLDSCWGFYGLDYCKEEVSNSVEYYANKAHDQWDRNQIGYEALI